MGGTTVPNITNSQHFGTMDNLVYTYSANSNKLLKVVDSANKTYGFRDGTNTGDDYAYDANGNMTRDLNKGIGTLAANGIAYNFLNLPTEVKFDNSNTRKINYIYDATGNKLEKKVTEGSTYTIENGSVYVVVNGEWEKQIEQLPEVVINTSSTNIEELQSLGAGSLGANIGGNTVAPILENSIPNLGKNDFLLGRIDPKYATDFNNSATSTAMGNVYEKGADDALRALNKVRVATKLVGTVANVAGYSTAVSEAANGNYGGAAIEGTSASISWKLGSIYWMYGIAWSAGWEGGRAITNTEAYNRKAFGIYSDIYIQRKIANNWGPLTPLQQHLVEARKL